MLPLHNTSEECVAGKVVSIPRSFPIFHYYSSLTILNLISLMKMIYPHEIEYKLIICYGEIILYAIRCRHNSGSIRRYSLCISA
nr:MAG TPA: hypothetical protein [Caudoviricetes sp.]